MIPFRLTVRQWERRTVADGTEQKALFSVFRFCWLRRRTDLGEHGGDTTDKRVTIGDRAQWELSPL